MSKTLDNSMIDMAWAIAHKAHAGQVYERGNCNWEYITHIKRVVHNLGDVPSAIKIIAILHDVVEDSDVTFREIGMTFGPIVCSAMVAITHTDDETYSEYIKRCSQNPIAKMVKAIDIADHILHCVRPDCTGDWKSMLDRYSFALRLLFNLS